MRAFIMYAIAGLLPSLAAAARAPPASIKSEPQQLQLAHHAGHNTTVPVTFYIFPRTVSSSSSSSNQSNKLPLLFLMNGANVEAAQYSEVRELIANLLTQRGYTFVASDYYQPLSAQAKQLLANSTFKPPAFCSADEKILSPTSALLGDFVQYAQKSKDATIKEALARGVVLISHSQGGLVSLEMLAQSCAKPRPASPLGSDLCQGYQPPLPQMNISAGSKCSTDSGSATAGTLLGVVAYEGYRGGVTGPVGLNLSPGTFVLFLAGQYNDNTEKAYQTTNTSWCSCASFMPFGGLNHYGMNNFQGEGRRQVTPCGRPGRSDPANFSVTSTRQAQALQQEAELIDRFIRAWVLRDSTAVATLQQQAAGGASSSSSSSGAGGNSKLQLKGECFKQ